MLNGENVYFSSLERSEDGVQEPTGLKIGDAFWDQKQIYIKCNPGLVYFKELTTSQGKMKCTQFITKVLKNKLMKNGLNRNIGVRMPLGLYGTKRLP